MDASSSGFQLTIDDALKGIYKAHKDDAALKKPGWWFFQGSIIREWKFAGSLLWIHGKMPVSQLLPHQAHDGPLSASWLGEEPTLQTSTTFWPRVTNIIFSSTII